MRLRALETLANPGSSSRDLPDGAACRTSLVHPRVEDERTVLMNSPTIRVLAIISWNSGSIVDATI